MIWAASVITYTTVCFQCVRTFALNVPSNYSYVNCYIFFASFLRLLLVFFFFFPSYGIYCVAHTSFDQCNIAMWIFSHFLTILRCAYTYSCLFFSLSLSLIYGLRVFYCDNIFWYTFMNGFLNKFLSRRRISIVQNDFAERFHNKTNARTHKQTHTYIFHIRITHFVLLYGIQPPPRSTFE